MTLTAADMKNMYTNHLSAVDIVLPNVTTEVYLLSNRVTNQTTTSAFAMLDLLSNIYWVTSESKVTVLSDQDTSAGKIFSKNESYTYDVMILGHQEYVTDDVITNVKFDRFLDSVLLQYGLR